MLGERSPSEGRSRSSSATPLVQGNSGFIKTFKIGGREDTEYNQETMRVSGGDGEALQRRPASPVILFTSALPEPAELIAGQDGDAGPADEDSRQAGSWGFTQFLEGIGEEEHLNSLSSVVAAFLERAKPTGFTGTDFDFAKAIGSDLAKISGMLRQPDSEGRNLTDALALEICKAMKLLEQQEVGTSSELNDKFTQGSEATGEFLNVEASREVYDAGLAHRIGPLNDKDVVGAMYDEHNKEEYSKEEFVTTNYGVTTDPLKEWIAAAGE
jgi:hypothetical protein